MKNTKKNLPIKTPSALHIGILGGGQLARLMVLEGYRLGIQTTVFCHSDQDPGALVSASFQIINKKNNLYFSKKHQQILKQLTHLTFESEFFNIQTLRQQLQPYPNLVIYPTLDNMEQLQHRESQKKLLDQYKIPTSPWIKLNQPQDWTKISNLLTPPFVYKKNSGGYDGNGTVISHKIKPFEGDWIVESFAPFKRELAVTAICHPQAGIQFYPLVQTHQLNSRCDWVCGPIVHPQWPLLQKKLTRLLKSIQYQGVIAFELFDLGPKQLLVNEVAPRVHNSSHYTQTSHALNQFAAHLVSANLPIKKALWPSQVKSFVMVNLIAQPDKVLNLDLIKQGQLHWYGKMENKPGRKMGHVNYGSHHLSFKKLLKIALAERLRISQPNSPKET